MESIGARTIWIRLVRLRYALIALTLIIGPGSAFAEVNVVGDLNWVNIEAQNCSVEEILNSLIDRFDFHYRSTADLSAQITGIYRGSLLHVLPRLLSGYNYFVKSAPDRLDLTVLGAEKTKAETVRNGNSQLNGLAGPNFGRNDLAAPGAETPQGSVGPNTRRDHGNDRNNTAEPEFGG